MNPHRTLKSIVAFAALVAMFACPLPSLALITINNGGAQPNGTYSASATDLGEAPPATVTSFTGTANYGSSPASLFNGTVYGAGTPFDTGESLLPSPGSVLVLSFDLTGAPVGYDLTSIVSLTGVGGGGQGSRLPQHYDVEYSTYAAPATFLPLVSVNQSAGGPDNSEMQVTVTDSLSAPIARHAAALRITFDPTHVGPSDGLFYREFDINGVAAIPEPASLGLVALGSVMLLRRRRENRRAGLHQ